MIQGHGNTGIDLSKESVRSPAATYGPLNNRLEFAGHEVTKIPVRINNDIIRLFSEGLYRSPHKAVEELVTNGYDAGAKRVHVLLPDQADGDTSIGEALWVVDDGHGMDENGFRQLWRVADTNKDEPLPGGRVPIGQFGIGKLAAYVTDPLVRSVRHIVETRSESFYIKSPAGIEEAGESGWLASYEEQISSKPFNKTEFVRHGSTAPSLRYDPRTRNIEVNVDHPFVDKLTGGGKHRGPAKLFASSEVLMEGQLRDHGINWDQVATFIMDRDRVLRLAAGDAPRTATEVLRLLDVANQSATALERATGAVFRVLGFRYERRGGSDAGPDGVLFARLGWHKGSAADYKLVYDAKQTNKPSVPADKIDIAALDVHREKEKADYGFFIAASYAAEAEDGGAVNQRIQGNAGARLVLLKIAHLRELVRLHYTYGVTLTQLRSLFEKCRTVVDVDGWLNSHAAELDQMGEVPLDLLLSGLEAEKKDPKASPHIVAVRRLCSEMMKFTVEQLIARMRAVENIVGSRWLEVDEQSGIVTMHQTAGQIMEEFDRNVRQLPVLGTVNPVAGQ